MVWRRDVTVFALGGILALAAPAAVQATPFELIYNGYFTDQDVLGLAGGPATPFANGEGFTATAYFDTSSPNLVGVIPVASGFVDYAPTSLSLTVGGVTYGIAAFNPVTNPAGLTVGIFDATTIFGVPGHVAIGFIQNPLADGAGIVGDWNTTVPPFSAANLGDISFPASEFFGVGYSSGVCIVGTGGNCTLQAVTPIPLASGGQSYLLTFSAGGGPQDVTYDPAGTPLEQLQQSAFLIELPEPGSLALLAGGVALWRVMRRRPS